MAAVTTAIGIATATPIFRALRGLSETQIAKENPRLMIIIPCLAFTIVFGASALSSYMTTTPIHIDMEKMEANVTQYCIEHLAKQNISLQQTH